MQLAGRRLAAKPGCLGSLAQRSSPAGRACKVLATIAHSRQTHNGPMSKYECAYKTQVSAVLFQTYSSCACRSMKREKSARPKLKDVRIFFSSAELHPSPKNVRPSFLPSAQGGCVIPLQACTPPADQRAYRREPHPEHPATHAQGSYRRKTSRAAGMKSSPVVCGGHQPQHRAPHSHVWARFVRPFSKLSNTSLRHGHLDE
jgi:hypothetical protein